MRRFKRWHLKKQLRVAARLNATGQLADPYYGALATRVLFELAGRDLKVGETFSDVEFELAVPRALALPTAYQWAATHLLEEYGPYHQAPTFLAAGNYDTATGTAPTHTWNARTEEQYEKAMRRVSRRGRLKAWAVSARPTFKANVGTFFWIVVTAVVTAMVTRLITCP